MDVGDILLTMRLREGLCDSGGFYEDNNNLTDLYVSSKEPFPLWRQDFTLSLRLTTNSQSSCLCFQSTGINCKLGGIVGSDKREITRKAPEEEWRGGPSGGMPSTPEGEEKTS